MEDAQVVERNLDPDLNRFISIIHEIPNEIRPHVFKTVPNIGKADEIGDNLKNLITKACEEAFRKFWEQNDVTRKINNLKQLHETSPDEDAWRPLTGTVDVNPIIVEHLHKKQEQLQIYLESLEEESAELKSYIKQFHQETEVQMAKMDAIEEQF